MSGNTHTRTWHLGAQNDGLFIIDREPRHSGTDHPVHEYREAISPDVVLPVWQLPNEKAQAVCDAHNASVASFLAESSVASDVLDALQTVVSAIGDWARPTGSNGMIPAGESHPLVVAARAGSAAIAKAEGK